ncbi:acyl-CoA dehydrogenase family protein [Streptomyces sp. NPDC058107]|uniref:acyl-CoA dehydrogenase family protein n=1 Tax=Streptomyces sp. NPDC058107 TaxID=3346343 RepID=UPI0036EA899F
MLAVSQAERGDFDSTAVNGDQGDAVDDLHEEMVVRRRVVQPGAGTDLASLTTRAELDGDEWVINGQKTWNSAGHHCTHEWLCVRTERGSVGHRGLSVIIVPIDAPGPCRL